MPTLKILIAEHRRSPEHPFRKLFAKRKEFYQTISQRKENYSSVNRLLWRKRHCALCCADNRDCSEKNHKMQQQQRALLGGSSSKKQLTLKARIEPFPAFTIRHDAESGRASIDGSDGLNAVASSTAEVATEVEPSIGENMELTADGKELRYAKSTINSEDGVESHLEVSVGVDGQGRTEALTEPWMNFDPTIHSTQCSLSTTTS